MVQPVDIKAGALEPDIVNDGALNDAQKLEKQRAKDIAYTINHALACTLVDWFGQTPAMIVIQKTFGVKEPVHVGCSNPFHHHEAGQSCGHAHDDHHEEAHSHDDGHSHDHTQDHAHEHVDPEQMGRHKEHIAALAKTFTASELIGDFAGVVPTVMMQRYTPWAMDGIRPALRATLGPVFHWGAEKSTQKWAREEHVDVGSDEYVDHREAIYEHEMHHLPQAAWWTAWSSALNVALQKPFYETLATPQIRHEFPLGTLAERIGTKVGGASLSIGLVLGTRALFPDTSHGFTNWTEDKLITPATKVIAGGMGIDSQTVQSAVDDKKQYHNA